MAWQDIFLKTIAGEHYRDEPLSGHTSFRIGGPADLFCVPHDAASLRRALALAAKEQVPVLVLGGGCNLLVSDEGFRGLVLRVPDMGGEPRVEGVRVTAPAGMLLNRLVNACAAAGLSGFENLAGIPGTVGGAVFMNAGAYGCCVADVFQSAQILSAENELRRFAPGDLEFSYRSSLLQRRPGLVVFEAEFQLVPASADELKKHIRDILATRARKHPLSVPSAGSFFKNIRGLPAAGRLIEDAGLKGLRVGGAMVSDIHANFLVNAGDATCDDMLRLMAIIQDKVERAHGVRLEPEVRIVREIKTAP